jgi:hypothetical protein
MKRDSQATHLRLYLLGRLTDEETTAIEHEYFDRPDALDRACAAEDGLIDDYLSGRLQLDEHEWFEGHYLAAPHHRTRVAVARALRSAASSSAGVRRGSRVGWLAMAAALVLLVGGSMWLLRRPAPAALNAPAASTTPPPERPSTSNPAKPPVTIALSIAPINVRSAGETATLVIPAPTDLVVLQLQGDPSERALNSGRAIIRTVAGTEVWRGAVVADARGIQAAALARLEVPADRLEADDYIVELFDTDAGGREVERYRYFFRVRD